MKILLLKLALLVLGAGMMTLSAYLALVKDAGEVESSLPLVVAFLVALIMSALPKQEPVPLEERLEELCTAIVKVVHWFSWLEVEILAGLIAVLFIIATFLPKAFIVLFACVASIGVSGLVLALTLGRRKVGD